MDHFKKKKLGLMALEKRMMLDASLPALTGQVLWLDAADPTKILDAQGDNAASGAAFSGTVATWLDKSSTASHVTAVAPGNEPTYTAAGLNGKSVLTFNGTTSALQNPTSSLIGDDFTVFIVFNRTTVAGRDALMELGGGGNRNGFYVNNSGASEIAYYNNGAFNPLSGTYTPGTFEMVSFIHDAASLNGWVNASNSLSTTGAVRSDTTGITIGDDSTSGDQLQGNIAEIIVYNRDLTSDQRHDVETYLAAKWGLTITNAPPVVDINAGMTQAQGSSKVIQSLVLASSDPDNDDIPLIYTITDLPDYGTLTNSNTGLTLGVGDTFAQADLSGNYIRYTHNGSTNFADSFSFTVSDQYQSTAVNTFNFTMTSANVAPVIEGWTLVSSENFESGATGWSDNTTETSNPYLTRFLGRHSLEGGAQNTYKNYSLSGTQDYTVVTFDVYEIDSWDGENFMVYINNSVAFSGSFSQGVFNTVSSGSSGVVSWTVQNTTPFNTNFAYGSWTDQSYHFTMIVDNSSPLIKLGFSSTLDQAVADEAWGVDNIKIYEVGSSATPGPMEVVENTANGSVVGRVTATDANPFDTISYSIIGGTGAAVFNINSSTGVITVANSAALNYEVNTSFTLIVQAADDGSPVKTDSETITINVLDMPENTAPVIPATGPFTVAENAANNTVVGTVAATDAESNTITYSITGGNTAGVFAINSATGALRILSNANLNYETTTSYSLTITATDNGFGNLTSSRAVTVNVTNVNEAPTFDPIQNVLNNNPGVSYNATTGNFYRYVASAVSLAAAQAASTGSSLNSVAGHLVTVTSAAENTFVRGLIGANIWMDGTDSGTEGQWLISSGPNAGQMFWLGGTGGSVQNGLYANWQAGQPDDNGGAEDFLQLRTDGFWNDIGSAATQAYVIEWEGTTVMATLQNGPYTTAENVAIGTSIGFARSSDPDVGDTRSYSITGGTGSGLFAINATTGEITSTGALNYEAGASYTLNLRVQDVGGLFDTKTVTINITDVNETPTLNAAGPFNYNENTAAGTLITTMTATDPDTGQTLTYTIRSGNGTGTFAINSATGALTFATPPNFEAGGTYNLVIRVTDNGTGALFNEKTVTVTINNLNESPVFDPVQQVLASDPTLRYNAASGNFYRYVNSSVTLAAARTAAAGAMLYGTAGHVATSNSAAENTFLTGLITATAWLDATDSAVEGQWAWASGPEAGPLFWLGNGTGSAQNGLYNAWSGGEPNDSGGAEDGVQLRTNGTWNDTNLTGSNTYIIEWEGAAIIASLQSGPYSINENSAIGSVVGTAHANDPDVGDTWTYSVIGGTGAGLFTINPTTGQITTTGALNYEAGSSYTLDLRAQDVGGLFDIKTVTINIGDLNETPVLNAAGPFNFNENVVAGTAVTTMTATDQDTAQTLTYSIQSGNTNGMFTINSATGALSFAGSPDFEYVNTYNLVIRVTDNGTGSLFDQKTVNITINDVNEAPVFDPIQQVLATDPTLRYNATTGNFYKYVPVATSLAGANAAAAGHLLYGTAGHLVVINSAVENAYVAGLITGSIWLDASDAAVEGQWRWGSGPDAGALFWLGTGTGSAQNGYYTNWSSGEPNDFSSGEDAAQMLVGGAWNDIGTGGAWNYVVEWEGAGILAGLQNGPYTLAENTAAGTSVGFAHAYDPDAGDVKTFTVTGGTGAGLFAINSATGEITLTGAVDFELASSYTLDLRVQDIAGLFDTKTVTINITDLNEVPVLAPAGPFTFNENIAPGTAVTTMTAADQDGGQTLTYSIQSGNTGGMFAIDSSTGALTFVGSPDFETVSSYNLVIRVTDDGTGALYAEQTVAIGINDLNEVPILAPAGPFAFNENVAAGTVVTTMAATDQDAGQTLTYSIQSGNTGGMFAIDASTGALTFAGSPDFETLSSYNLVIRVTDDGTGALYAEQTVAIGINDLNEVPVLAPAGPFTFNENIAPGTAVTTMTATDQDGGQTLTYSIQSGNTGGMFAIDSSTGALTFVGSPDFETVSSYNLVIRVTDDGTGALYAEQTVAIGINDLNEVPVLAPAGPFTFNENVPAGTAVTTMTATDQDGGQTLTYSIQSGNTGGMFAIDATTGALTFAGSPDFEALNAYSLVIRVTDNGTAALYAEQTVDIAINDVNDPPTIINLSYNHITENSAIGTPIGLLSAIDQDATDTHTFTLITNPDGKFALVGNQLVSAGDIDYERNQSFDVIVRADDGHGGILDQTFRIFVDDQADTFTPVPTTPPSSVPVRPSTPIVLDSKVPSLVLDTLAGGEFGQMQSFYGMGDFHQILRENMIYEIRDLEKAGPETLDQSGDVSLDIADATAINASDLDRPVDRFTNLREALQFFEQMKDTGGEVADQAETSVAVSTDQTPAERNLPPDTIDRQFVDVMTYHEQRQARLREALKNA